MKTLLVILVFWATSAQAQYKTEKTIYDIKRTQNNVEEIKNIGQGLKGLLPKKKAKPADTVKVEVTPPTAKVVPPATARKTVITIIGLDFSRLKTLNENIRACAKVESSTMKFDPKESFIEIMHSGTTEDLLKIIQETSSEIFSEKNIAGFSEGSVTLKI